MIDPILEDLNDEPPTPPITPVVVTCTDQGCNLVEIGAEKAVFALPWYRTVPQVPPSVYCVEQGDLNYTPYNVFCLKTRLSDFVSQVVGEVVFSFLSFYTGNKMSLNLVLSQYVSAVEYRSAFQTMNVSPDQRRLIEQKINDILTVDPLACLLISPDINLVTLGGDRIPNPWIRQVLPFVMVDAQYRPFVNDDGYHVDLSAWTIRTPEEVEVDVEEMLYDEKYQQLQAEVVEKLRDMYDDGYFVVYGRLSSEIADKWGFIPVDNEGQLYRPNWRDRRVTTNLVEFCLARVRGEEFIRLPIEQDDVQRHAIGRLEIPGLTFSGSQIRVPATSINQVRLQVSLIEQAKAESQFEGTGVVRVGFVAPPAPYVSYATDDLLKPVTYSSLL